MNPEMLFCPNLDCPARGQRAKGNITIHSKQEKRAMCAVCQKSFSHTKGTIFYRLRTDPAIVIQVIILLANGCPVQAIVAAFDLDARTVKSWWQRAGQQCEQVHSYLLESTAFDLQHVQADEIKVKCWGQSVWLAMAIMVSTRLWLGGAISPSRNKELIESLAEKIKSVALCRPLLLAVDGLPSYVNAFQKAFRAKVPRFGKPGSSKLVAWPNIVIARVIKQRSAKTLTITRVLAQGTEAMANSLIKLSQNGSGVINTAYIERINATFRQRLAWLSRRSRALIHDQTNLEAGMYIVGCFYNFVHPHKSLRLRLWLTDKQYRWVKRTPAMATNLTDHIWTPIELLQFRVPPKRWTPPKQRGRKSKALLKLIQDWC